jgi:hypothetical protein
VAWGTAWPIRNHQPQCDSIRFEAIGTSRRVKPFQPGPRVGARCPIGSDENVAWCCSLQPGCLRISANNTPPTPISKTFGRAKRIVAFLSAPPRFCERLFVWRIDKLGEDRSTDDSRG